MPLTPSDIHEMSFPRPPASKQGYDENQVDMFLDEVGREFSRLTAANQALRHELLAAELERLKAEQAAAERHARSVQAELERARTEARAEPDPRDTGAGVLAMAQRTADRHLSDARREADKLMTEASIKADQLTSEAEIKAATIDSDARHWHTQAMSNLADERATALNDIDRLSMLVQSHHEAVAGEVRLRLRDLANPAGAGGR
ncbi:DivIVA domain-containing protein [Actinoplanes sp. NEAU-A12]|uniref:Cell wall synthesis protein Wag31 n=1 Tax=Actinoplanes sandaracinus TaxID=3045177 RepID=A0ABT6WII7_9ACTN|nr:DivIVA domain-containing protein [Actinoplanes sandaracinus]MDI6099535.1 DivIVA domain-containing protein [Actinoplanes sandaracinus]